jgi:S-formylglutathione hydrolase FrmB
VVGALLYAAPLAGQPARGRVDTVTFRSQALGISKNYVIYLPPSYEREAGRRYPVAYYLHGLWGDEYNWTTLGRLRETADSLFRAGLPEVIVVMPDGDDSWYTTWNFLGDWPGCQRQPPPGRSNEKVADYCVPWPHYDDYIARDLVQHIDSTFRTLPERRHRGIAGLSMGGYGATWLALAYPYVFGAAASHSGIVTPLLVSYDRSAKRPRYAREIPEVRERYPNLWPSQSLAFGKDTAGWWARDPARRAAKLIQPNSAFAPPRLYIDVGTDDPYLQQSRAFRDALRRLGIAHEYHERPGAHNWGYWGGNVAHSLAFITRAIAAG